MIEWIFQLLKFNKYLITYYLFTGHGTGRWLETFFHYNRCQPILWFFRQMAVCSSQTEGKSEIWQTLHHFQVRNFDLIVQGRRNMKNLGRDKFYVAGIIQICFHDRAPQFLAKQSTLSQNQGGGRLCPSQYYKPAPPPLPDFQTLRRLCTCYPRYTRPITASFFCIILHPYVHWYFYQNT